MLFPGKKIPILVYSKHISVIFKSEKKKKSPHFFYNFPTSIFIFPPSLLQFPFFSSQFFTPFPFFPDTSAKISRSEVSGGTLPPLPLPSPACYATGLRMVLNANFFQKSRSVKDLGE